MRAPLLAMLCSAVAVAGLTTAGAEELKVKAGEQILAIGDSITKAGGYLRNMDAVFARQYPDLKLPPIINAGINGQKSGSLVKRFDKDVIARKPAVVIISIGINDVWHRLNGTNNLEFLKQYTDNVTKLVGDAQQAGIRVVLCTPTIIGEEPEAEGNQRLALYCDAIRKIAAAQQCILADLHPLFLDALRRRPAGAQGNQLTTDGVHMAAAGDRLMAGGILKALGVPPAKLAAGP